MVTTYPSDTAPASNVERVTGCGAGPVVPQRRHLPCHVAYPFTLANRGLRRDQWRPAMERVGASGDHRPGRIVGEGRKGTRGAPLGGVVGVHALYV